MKKVGVVVHTCHPSNDRKCKIGGSELRLAWAKKQNPICKISRAKRAGGMAQAVEHLPSRVQIPGTSRKRGNKKEKKTQRDQITCAK
jgi:hypothetical protein